MGEPFVPTAPVGESIPAHTSHAVSVSLPTWKANVAYEEGESWVIDNLSTGYPRFFVHKLIRAFAEDIVKAYGNDGQQAMLFASSSAAKRCQEFMLRRDTTIKPNELSIVNLAVDPKQCTPVLLKANPRVSAVLFSAEKFPVAKQYWQHSGDGVSSRRAEFCHGLFQEGVLIVAKCPKPTSNGVEFHKGPKRYQKTGSVDKSSSTSPIPTRRPSIVDTTERESSQFVEERFGRNLDVSHLAAAKSAIRRRIAGSLTENHDLAIPFSKMEDNIRGVTGLDEDDVYLHPCGMNAIFSAHQLLLRSREPRKSIVFGFPYVDTLKIVEKFGPGALFYGNGGSADLDDLERRLEAGERYLGLFTEFPGNPLLKSPDLQRIWALSQKYDFVVVVDETIGNSINVHVLPYADIVVSSLTKIFAGECNVMGGSLILNPESPRYKSLKAQAEKDYEDNYWAEDALFMERNSRDFMPRVHRINANAEALCDLLQKSPIVKDLYYPKFAPSRPHYDACRTKDGGYGGLLSITFHNKAQAVKFFDTVKTAKGPSLGTNFTLTSPYVVLAHYGELDWAKTFGVHPDLIRISVGLEETSQLVDTFATALKEAENTQEAV